MSHRYVSVCALACALASCGTYTPRQVAEPSSVTVREAVFEVATTLRDVQDLVPPDKRAGLLADEVTVVFNVAATATTTSGADLRISNVALPSGTLGAGASTENVSEGTRGNQITIKFKNIATADMTKGALSLKQFQSQPVRVRSSRTSPQSLMERVRDQVLDTCRMIKGICVLRNGVLEFDAKSIGIEQDNATTEKSFPAQ